MKLFRNKRIDRVDERIDQIDKHFSRIDEYVALSNERVGSVDKRVDSLDERVGSTDKHIDLTGKRLDRVESLTTGIEETLKTNDAATKEIVRRLGRSNKCDLTVRVAFVFQMATIWPSWKTIWEACREDPRFVVFMVLAPFRYADRELKLLDESKQTLVNLGIPFYNADAFSFETFSPDVVFMQMPYTDSLPLHLQPESAIASGAKIAYVPYGLEMGGGGLNLRYQFDLPLHRVAWRIFARSERHRAMFAKYCRTGSGHVVVAGHPRFDLISSAPPITETKRNELAGDRRIVMWNPHFSVGQPAAWSTFDVYGDAILNAVEARPNIHLLIRPHPLLFVTLRARGWREQDETEFRRRVAQLENCSLDESEDYLAAFAMSDALMTDAGSFLLEYFATGKPLLYLKRVDGHGLNDDGDIEEFIYGAPNADEIVKFLDMIANGHDPKADARRAAMPKFIPFVDGKCGERIRDHLYAAFVRDDLGSARGVAEDQNHKHALQYWRRSENTYLAPPDYYDRQEAALRSCLEGLHVNSALDVGCGDGRFTRVLAEHARQTHGIDVSQSLLDRAKAAALEGSASGTIRYELDSLEEAHTCGTYDLVACMGVLSGFLNTFALLKAADVLTAMVRPGGSLILKETLSSSADQILSSGDYLACYRNQEQYLRMFLRRGFTLVSRRELAKDPEKCQVNELYLLTRGLDG